MTLHFDDFLVQLQLAQGASFECTKCMKSVFLDNPQSIDIIFCDDILAKNVLTGY